jgi:hypothetical protein
MKNKPTNGRRWGMLLIFAIIVVAGCRKPPASASKDLAQDKGISRVQPNYPLLTEPPDNVLDRMASSYPQGVKEFRIAWTEQTSSIPLDGQRAIELLEIACYADAICHAVEYPLRVATLDYIEANLQNIEILEAVQWIPKSYRSHLPLNAPNDDNEHLRGLLVESMNHRMVDYAEELLNPKVPSQHRKLQSIAANVMH